MPKESEFPVHITGRIRRDTHRAIRRLAKQRKETKAATIRWLIEAGLKQESEK